MSIKHPKVTVLLLLVQLGHTRDCSMYKYIYFRIFLEIKMSAVNPNTPHSPPACTMFNEVVQYLTFFMFFAGVTIMSASWQWCHHQNLAQYLEGGDLDLGYIPAPAILLYITFLLNILFYYIFYSLKHNFLPKI